MPINNINPEELVKVTGIINRNQAYKRLGKSRSFWTVINRRSA